MALGFAPIQGPSIVEPPRPGATPRQPALDPNGPDARPAARRPIIDAKKNPLAAIGALLQDFGRGMQGKPLYTEELIAQRAEQEALHLKRAEVGGQLLTKGMELLKNTPAQNREKVASQFGALYENMFPGFTDTLIGAYQQPEVTEQMLGVMGEHGKTLIGIAGSLEGALELAQKPEFMKHLDKQADARNAPEITQALQRAQTILSQDPAGNEAMARAASDGWTLTDLQDPAIQEALGLTKSHVASIARSPEIQKSLRPLGFVPTMDLDAKAKKDINEVPLDEKVREATALAAAETRAREGEKIVPFQGADGSVVRKPQKMADELAKMGFMPIVTGRTPDDTAAADKARAKDAAGKAVPVDPYFARAAEIDPNTTIQEAIDMGLTPELDEPTRRGLQGAESGARQVSNLIGQARTIIQQNPDANTRVAALSGFATNVGTELEALGRATGIKIDVAREIKDHEDILKKNGIDNALMRQLAISLAYMNAKSLDESGRLSDSDVRNSAKALGASASDPDILLNVLDQAELNADSSFRNRVKAATGADRKSLLPDIKTADEIAARIANGQPVTREELKALPPRARRYLESLPARKND
ncbi:MAG: hypothetical protein AB7Q01_15025 [Gammaproteobacteria bacterium]